MKNALADAACQGPLTTKMPWLSTIMFAGLGHSVKLEDDGSFAALVPAAKSVSWALSDDSHYPVVRERYWVNFASGEVRVCASCHGVNDAAQDGSGVPQNPPKALRVLLENWQAQQPER